MDESMNQEGISDALAWRGCQLLQLAKVLKLYYTENLRLVL